MSALIDKFKKDETELEKALRKAKQGSNIDKQVRMQNELNNLRADVGDVEQAPQAQASQTDIAPKVDASNKAAGMSKAVAQLSSSSAGGGGIVQGGASGAATGFQLAGGTGALVGGAVGAGLGALKARQARKQAQAELENKKQMAKAQIEDDKTQRINNALSSLQATFASTLVGNSPSLRF